MRTLIDGLQIDEKKDILCITNQSQVVINTGVNFFCNKNMSEVTDEKYKVLGKVTKTCSGVETISLMRNTAFSKLKLDKMAEFQTLFDDPSLKQFWGEKS